MLIRPVADVAAVTQYFLQDNFCPPTCGKALHYKRCTQYKNTAILERIQSPQALTDDVY